MAHSSARPTGGVSRRTRRGVQPRVATSPDQWANLAAYYPAGQRWNNWAEFFHANSIDNLAYGFPYDDVNSQSSVLILGNSRPADSADIRP